MAPTRRGFLGRLGSLVLAVPLTGCNQTRTNGTEQPPAASPTATDEPPVTATRTTTDIESAEDPDYIDCTGDSTTATANVFTSDPPNADDALVTDSCLPVQGTNVNVGVQGTAKNITSRWLVDCVVDVTGVVDGQTFRARATRSPLSPQDTWEWEVPFGSEADSLSDNSPERITITTRAEYMEWE